MGTDISHIVKHTFKQFNDRTASRVYCEEVYRKLRKKLLLGDGEPDWDEPGVLDDEEYFLRINIADYDMSLDLHPDFWDVESLDRYSQLITNEDVRKKAFDVVRALGANEAWHAADYFTWCGSVMVEFPGCNFSEWMDHLDKEYGKAIKEFTHEEYWRMGSNGYLYYEEVYHDNFKECFDEFDRLQDKIPDYRLLGIARVGDFLLRCEKDDELYLIDERTKRPFLDFPVKTYWTFDEHFVVIKDGKSALFDHCGSQLTPYVKGHFEMKNSFNRVQRGGIKMCLDKRVIENKEACLSVTVGEQYRI